MMPELFDRIARGYPLFLTSLPDVRGGGFIKQGMARTAEEVELFVKAYGRPTQSIYFAVGRLKDGATERLKDTVASVSCIWADIDFKHHPDIPPGEIERRLGWCR